MTLVFLFQIFNFLVQDLDFVEELRILSQVLFDYLIFEGDLRRLFDPRRVFGPGLASLGVLNHLFWDITA
jgi:hypothetical protein